MISELQAPPSTISLYRRAVVNTVLNDNKKSELPEITISLRGIKTTRSKMRKYAKVCGFSDLEHLAATYPHILAFPLHMEILVNKQFPFPLLGLVHVRNKITQYRKIKTGEVLDICCTLTGQRSVDKGIEFDIETKVTVGDELVWDSVSTNLHRQKSKEGGKKKSGPKDAATYDHTTRWTLPESLGRSYAGVSGDVNPIHLFGVTAKLFGFKRAIAHGMWSKARCLAELEMELPKGAFTADFRFKLPMFIPAKVQMMYTKIDDEIHLELRDNKGEKPHLAGTITLASN